MITAFMVGEDVSVIVTVDGVSATWGDVLNVHADTTARRIIETVVNFLIGVLPS